MEFHNIIQIQPGSIRLLEYLKNDESEYKSLFSGVKSHLQVCSECRVHFNKAVLSTMPHFVGKERASVWALRMVGFSYKEIAKSLNIAEGTAKSHMYYVRKNWISKLSVNFGVGGENISLVGSNLGDS